MADNTQIQGTALLSSRIALGTWAIGGWMWGGCDQKESIRTIHAALDKGINLIDTAPIYGYPLGQKTCYSLTCQTSWRALASTATRIIERPARGDGEGLRAKIAFPRFP